MRDGNPNQAKVVKAIRNLGYDVQIRRNQIHVKGVTESPFGGYSVPEGQTYGMTVAEASKFLERAKLDKFTDLVFQADDGDTWPKGYKNPSSEYLKQESLFRGKQFNITEEMKLAGLIFQGYRLTRNEFSNAVSQSLILRDDTDKDYEEFMASWFESEKQFGYGSPAKPRD